MFPDRMESAVVRLATAALSVRPLIDVMPPTVRVAADPLAGERRTLARLLDRVMTGVGGPRLRLCPSPDTADLNMFEQIVSRRLDLAGVQTSVGAVPRHAWPRLDDLVGGVVRASFDGRMARARTLSADGAPLNVYTAGRAGTPAVIIASACGMPAKLCERWVRALEPDCFVVTWESRSLFGEAPPPGTAWDASAQAADLRAVLDCAGVSSAHVMGFCGGAVIALLAAAAYPDRVSSVSVWHGDFERGPSCPKTNHQQNVKALMDIAGSSPAAAASVRSLLCESTRSAGPGGMLTKIRPEHAHLVLYPFATADLLHRYSQLNGDLMRTDVGTVLADVHQPVLVVTSRTDDTAHPAGSIDVARRLPRATLRVEPEGDHLSLFDAAAPLVNLASTFIAAPVTDGVPAGAWSGMP